MEIKEYWNLNLHWVTKKKKAEPLTNAIANAGMRVR